ncbi:MAG: DUF4339 domain-containing protein [Bdellovibrionales bacterium]|nr:DUF4339 domain-containing protein [Bdellovibrionales bacterium]
MGAAYFLVKLAETDKTVWGPFTIHEVEDQIKQGLLSWNDIGCSPEDQQAWVRLHDIRALQHLIPKFPSADHLARLNARFAPSSAASKNLAPPFYLHVIGAEHGPFTMQEVRDLLDKTKFDEQVYLWCKTLQFWVPIQQFGEFAHLRFKSSKITKTQNDVFEKAANAPEGHEGRSQQRTGFVATIRVSRNGMNEKIFGVCIDVSTTGLQVRLENHLGLAKGEEISFEMMPLSLIGLPRLNGKARIAWYKQDVLCFGAEFIGFERDGWERLRSKIKT